MVFLKYAKLTTAPQDLCLTCRSFRAQHQCHLREGFPNQSKKSTLSLSFLHIQSQGHELVEELL